MDPRRLPHLALGLFALALAPSACAGDELTAVERCASAVECPNGAECACDGSGELLRVTRTLEDGRRVSYHYEGAAHWAFADVERPGAPMQRFRFVRTAAGEVTRLEVQAEDVVTGYGYGADGRVGVVEHVEGDERARWTIEYDDRGRVVRRSFDADADGTAERTWRCAWSSANRLMSASVDANANGTDDASVRYVQHSDDGTPSHSRVDDDGDGRFDRRVDAFIEDAQRSNGALKIEHCDAPSIPAVP